MSQAPARPRRQGRAQGLGPAMGWGLGMGLGLAVVSSLVWEVNGNCHIYNRTDRAGVVVEIVIPIFVESGA